MHLVNSRFLVSVPMISKCVLQHVCQHPFVLFRMTLSCHSSHLSQTSKINLGIAVVKYQRRLIVNEGEKRSKPWINFHRWRDFYCFSFIGKFVLTKRWDEIRHLQKPILEMAAQCVMNFRRHELNNTFLTTESKRVSSEVWRDLW